MADLNVTLSDSTNTSELLDVLDNSTRRPKVSDSTSLTEATSYAILNNPPAIKRTLSLTLKIPATISFTVIKKVV